jgi:hypothetical protein
MNPLTLLPIPLVLAALGLAAAAVLRYLDRLPVPRGHHRMTRAVAADPFRRDWAAIAAERIDAAAGRRPPVEPGIEYDPLDHRIPLAEVERRMALAALPAMIEATRERDGEGMWSWSPEDTGSRELAAV